MEKKISIKLYRKILKALISTGKTDYKAETEIFLQIKELHKQEIEKAYESGYNASVFDPVGFYNNSYK